jgi:hypothetical protein
MCYAVFWRFVLFGYIKPLTAELKVREFELYKSFYCGLCKSMGIFSRLTLSYDIVFLVLIRVALTGEPIEGKPFRCKLKPTAKRSYIKSNGSLEYSASAAGILNYYKCIDDVRDSKNKLKKIFLSIIAGFFLRGKNKACKKYAGLDEKIKKPLDNLHKLEREKCKSIDEAASAFAELMKNAAAFGLESEDESKSRIAAQIGWHLGRWLYIIDALDDFYKDLKKREYNAFIEYYGGKEDFLQDLDIIKYSLTSSLNEISAAFSLLNNSCVSPLILNILNLGLCSVQEKILNKYRNIKSNNSDIKSGGFLQ